MIGKERVAMAKGILAGDGARLDYVTLRFLDDPDVERAFLDDYYRKSINQMRIAIVLAIVITAAFGFRDVWITPAGKIDSGSSATR
jgi:hypothetical protein